MAPQDDDLLPENTSGYKLSQPKQSLAEYQKMGECSTWNVWLAGFVVFLPGPSSEGSECRDRNSTRASAA